MWIDIETSAGVKCGDGPIVTAQGWTYTDRLSLAGEFSFTMPASDPRAALCTPRRVARGWQLVNGTATEVGAGIIDTIEVDADQLTLAISGANLLRELTYRQVGTLAISGYTGPQTIIALAPTGWSLDVVTGHNVTLKSIAHTFEGETVLMALVKLAELTGENFRIGAGRKIIWMQVDQPDSTLRAVANGDPISLETETGLVIIKDLVQSQDTYDALYGRVYAVGSGNGGAVITLNGATLPAAYTAAGYVLGSDAQGYYLEHTATWAAYGMNCRQNFKDCTDQALLVEQTYEWMRKQLIAQESYRLDVLKVDAPLLVGSKLHVVYRKMVDSYAAVNVDASLRIMETSTQVDGTGVRVVGLTVSTIDQWIQTDNLSVVAGLTQAQNYYQYPQPTAGAAHHGAHENGGGDEISVAGLSGVLADAQRTVRQERVSVAGGLTVAACPVRIYNRTGGNLTISQVHLAVGTAPAGAAILVDVHKNGTTIFTTQSNRAQVADGATSGQSTTIEVATWADGEYLTVEVDQVGSGTAGSDLVVTVVAA